MFVVDDQHLDRLTQVDVECDQVQIGDTRTRGASGAVPLSRAGVPEGRAQTWLTDASWATIVVSQARCISTFSSVHRWAAKTLPEELSNFERLLR